MSNSQERRRQGVELQSLVYEVFAGLKATGAYLELSPCEMVGPAAGHVSLRTVSTHMRDFGEFVALATEWRNAHSGGFFSQFVATEPRTRRWLQTAIQDNPERILFMVEASHELTLGHMGLRYDPKEMALEVENILRGRDAVKGCMTAALSGLCAWAFRRFPVPHIFLRSFADNARAVALYRRCGFEEVSRWPVFPREEKDGTIVWRPSDSRPRSVHQRVVVMMKKSRHR